MKKDFLTNKLPNDLTYIKDIEATYDENVDMYQIQKGEDNFYLKKASMFDFIKVFYYKEAILMILIFAGSFFIDKYIFGIILVMSGLCFYLIKKNKTDIYLRYTGIITWVIVIFAFSSVLFAVLSIIKTNAFMYAVLFFFFTFLVMALDFTIKLFNKFQNKVFLIENETGNKLKGYMAWEKD